MMKAVCTMKIEGMREVNVDTGSSRSLFHAIRRTSSGANAFIAAIDTLDSGDVRIRAVLRRFAGVDEEGIATYVRNDRRATRDC